MKTKKIGPFRYVKGKGWRELYIKAYETYPCGWGVGRDGSAYCTVHDLIHIELFGLKILCLDKKLKDMAILGFWWIR